MDDVAADVKVMQRQRHVAPVARGSHLGLCALFWRPRHRRLRRAQPWRLQCSPRRFLHLHKKGRSIVRSPPVQRSSRG